MSEIATFIRENCIVKSKTNPYMFGKMVGTRYNSIYHLSNLLYDQHMLATTLYDLADLISEKFPGEWDFQVAGREWSAIPLITGLQCHASIPGFMIRRERKTYGDHNIVEGRPYKDLPVLLVDDVANSTSSFVHCRKVCESLGLEVLPYAVAVLNKYTPEMEGWTHDRYSGLEIISVCNGGDIWPKKST